MSSARSSSRRAPVRSFAAASDERDGARDRTLSPYDAWAGIKRFDLARAIATVRNDVEPSSVGSIGYVYDAFEDGRRSPRELARMIFLAMRSVRSSGDATRETFESASENPLGTSARFERAPFIGKMRFDCLH